MIGTARIEFHRSQFPEAVRRDLAVALRQKALHPKFLYEGARQTAKWLALHEACSPARTDADVQRIYARAYEHVLERTAAPAVQVIGLGCGSGAKDATLIAQLLRAGKAVRYVAVDASSGLVLTAREAALRMLPPEFCDGLVCDLTGAPDLPDILHAFEPALPAQSVRVLTAFGLLPAFEPDALLSAVARLSVPGERVLLSANLSPGQDYAAGVQKVLAGYDNSLTREWLMSALHECDIWENDGCLQFSIEEHPPGSGLLRIVADFCFTRDKQVRLDDSSLAFAERDRLRVFSSYRHTPEQVRALLAPHGLQVQAEWVSESGGEAVFSAVRI